ncbi:MAG: hypothetical protein R2731_02695 [Nocardioides sp.]
MERALVQEDPEVRLDAARHHAAPHRPPPRVLLAAVGFVAAWPS